MRSTDGSVAFRPRLNAGFDPKATFEVAQRARVLEASECGQTQTEPNRFRASFNYTCIAAIRQYKAERLE